MALAHSVADSADGTGVVVTISGSSGGTVTVNKATVSVSAIGAYSSAGTRTGDGTIGVSGTGYFSWYVSEGATTTTPTYQPATDGGDSVWERCLTMVKDRIVTLSLPAITSNTNVKVLADLDGLTLPTVIVSPTGESERYLGGPVGRDDVGYPVAVMLLQSTADDVEATRARYLRWRQRVERALHNGKWDERVPEVYTVTVEPAAAIDTGVVSEDRVRLGMLTAVCVARMSRGTT
jgi:hypothetical protein